MKILITGGAGFIGSNLAKRLVNDGHEVVVLDSLLRGNKLDKDTFNKLLFIKGDVRDRSLVIEASKGVDMIFHFAAVLGVDIVADNPVETKNRSPSPQHCNHLLQAPHGQAKACTKAGLLLSRLGRKTKSSNSVPSQDTDRWQPLASEG